MIKSVATYLPNKTPLQAPTPEDQDFQCVISGGSSGGALDQTEARRAADSGPKVLKILCRHVSKSSKDTIVAWWFMIPD